MKTKWSKLQEMEKKLYLEIITGVKELDEFDRFVEEWMEAGGDQITLEVTEAVREAKGADFTEGLCKNKIRVKRKGANGGSHERN